MARRTAGKGRIPSNFPYRSGIRFAHSGGTLAPLHERQENPNLRRQVLCDFAQGALLISTLGRVICGEGCRYGYVPRQIILEHLTMRTCLPEERKSAMNATTLRECESITRVVALWGSVLAAIVFGFGFLTDRMLSYSLVVGQADQIVLVLLVFGGYLLAWKKEYEVIGSVLALVAVTVFYAWCSLYEEVILHPVVLVVAAPALFHLLAVALHRRTLLVSKN